MERDEARGQLIRMFVTLRFYGDASEERLRAEAERRWPGSGEVLFP